MTQPTIKYRKDYTPPSHHIEQVDLHIELTEEGTYVKSRLKIKANPEAAASPKQISLHGRQQNLLSLQLNGEQLQPSDYEIDEEQLTIKNVPEEFFLHITTFIHPESNTSLIGLYKSNGNFCTQCEAEGFRKITYYLDRPDVLSIFTTTIVADKERYPILLSNGNLIDQGDLDDGRHFVKWQDPHKKPCYLFALVAGKLEFIEDSFITHSGRHVTLRIFCEIGQKNKCHYAMQALKKAMRWDEVNYGREYDLDIFMIVAVSDFNFGAMENKGLNIFNAKYILVEPQTATDADYAGIDVVVGHEYFHNWSGNRVTCRDWFQLSLKEGLTVFRDQSFSEDVTSQAISRIENVRKLRQAQFAEDAGPLAHPVRPDSYIEMNNFYTSTVYEKGAEIIRMLQTILGKDKFREAMDLYFSRHDGQAVTCDDYVQAMEDISGIDLTQFKRWYSQAGTPELTVKIHYDEIKQSCDLSVEQMCPTTPGQSEKLPFYLPLAIGLLNEEGRDIPLKLIGDDAATTTTKVLIVNERSQTFTVENIPCKPIPSLLRNFSAPVKLHYSYSSDELLFLMRHDSDAFSRYEAGHRYIINVLLQLIEDYEQGKKLQLNSDFVLPLQELLTNPNLDKALIANMLILPNENYLAELVKKINVEAIHVAKSHMTNFIANELAEDFYSIYQQNYKNNEYEYSVAETARRQLQNVCLNYLTQLKDSRSLQLAMQQFKQANNMTDRLAALVALNNVDFAERAEALAIFYQDWQHETLVMDKWFSVQAMSELPDTLNKVKMLFSHPAFNIKNPNKVRALIGAFCHNNPINFHATTGEGYKFLTEQVLLLDTLNPSIAARLVQALIHWQKYDVQRQQLMQEQLKLIHDHKPLSNDVIEIVSRGLSSS